MNKGIAITLLLSAMLCSSCLSMKQRTITIDESSQGQQSVITIDANIQSHFDPDGGSREYTPGVVIRLFGPGINMAYRNNPGTTFRYGKDFDVDVDYCSGGYLWVSEDMTTLGVALFDVKAPESFQRLKAFNGSYPITKKQAKLLLQSK